jgi:hypothetical protein
MKKKSQPLDKPLTSTASARTDVSASCTVYGCPLCRPTCPWCGAPYQVYPYQPYRPLYFWSSTAGGIGTSNPRTITLSAGAA